MDDFDIVYYFGYSMEDDEGIPENCFDDPFSYEYLPIDSFVNELYTFNKKNKDIEVIFFNDRIVMIVRTDMPSAKIGKLVDKFAFFENES
jgi:hypothetical protein